ncbi:MAG: ABC transporter substrate-binding protein [Actinomycetaceae bacterium]|nr:ABC transporter substrate-binding protein [Actinomycetaceae bacterium]
MPEERTHSRRGFLKAGGLLGVGAIGTMLTACSNADPFRNSDGGSDSSSVTIGSSTYYSAEIIGEIYAQRLEAGGFTAIRQFRIGPREVFLPELEAGNLELFPEYLGNLMQYFAPDHPARTKEEIYSALPEVLPDTIHPLGMAPASDQDSYNVTSQLAEEYGLKTIGDLKNLGRPVRIGANSEAKDRPYGQQGLKEHYGIDAQFVPIEDSGGPLTVKALQDGDVDVADIYTSDPAIEKNGFVTLEDPESLILPQNIIAIGHGRLTLQAASIVEDVNRRLTQSALVALNARSIDEQLSASRIAEDWIAQTW